MILRLLKIVELRGNKEWWIYRMRLHNFVKEYIYLLFLNRLIPIAAAH
jgi:hypothetical protein